MPQSLETPATHPRLDDAVLWSTHCRIPTATAVAEELALLPRVLGADAPLRFLRELDPEQAEDHHQNHDIPLVREGGNIPPLWARSRGADTRLIGLVWIEEGQAIVTRPGGTITTPEGLVGARVALPEPRRREPQLARPVVLHAVEQLLEVAGRSLEAVEFVEVPSGERPLDEVWRAPHRGDPAPPALQAVAEGRADAAYIVGPAQHDAALRLGLELAIDVDGLPSRADRVNLGTPRALTIDAPSLTARPQAVVSYLTALLRAARWAEEHPEALVTSIARATGASREATDAIYGSGRRGSLAIDLSPQLVGLYERQKQFLLRHGFIADDFDIEPWVDRRHLEQALGEADQTAMVGGAR